MSATWGERWARNGRGSARLAVVQRETEETHHGVQRCLSGVGEREREDEEGGGGDRRPSLEKAASSRSPLTALLRGRCACCTSYEVVALRWTDAAPLVEDGRDARDLSRAEGRARSRRATAALLLCIRYTQGASLQDAREEGGQFYMRASRGGRGEGGRKGRGAGSRAWPGTGPSTVRRVGQ